MRLIYERLRAAAAKSPFDKNWQNARDVVIAKDVFTKVQFYEGADQYLYLFEHCATKSCCEAVLEGMGSTWDRAAAPCKKFGLLVWVRFIFGRRM